MSLLKNQSQKSSQQHPQRTEQQTAPIIGLRVWRIDTIGRMPYLKSATQHFIWPYRKAMEIDAIMAMGIHAIKPGCGIIGLFQSYIQSAPGVAGEVYLWGKVAECTYGYLAQFAYPKKLFCPPEMDAVTIMQLEDEYGVPCEIRDEFSRPKQPSPQELAAMQTQFYPPYTYYSTQMIGIQAAGGFFQGGIRGIGAGILGAKPGSGF